MFTVWCPATRMYFTGGKPTFLFALAKEYPTMAAAEKGVQAAVKKFGAGLVWEIKGPEEAV